MEAVKTVIYPHGQVEVAGQRAYKYLIGLIVVSDQPFPSKLAPETVSMGSCEGLFEVLGRLEPKQAPYKLGDLTSAMIGISTMQPDELEPIE